MSNSNMSNANQQPKFDTPTLLRLSDIATRYAVEDDLTGVQRNTEQISARFVEEYPAETAHQGMIARLWNSMHGIFTRK